MSLRKKEQKSDRPVVPGWVLRTRRRMPNGMLCDVYPVKQNIKMRRHVGKQFAQSIKTKRNR